MKIIACGNQKGGCAKTTTVLNLCYSFSHTYGMKVLMVDLDSQASASQNLRLDPDSEEYMSIAQLLYDYVMNPREKPSWDVISQYIVNPQYKARRKIMEGNKINWETYLESYGFDVIPSSLPLSTVELTMSLKGGQATGGKHVYAYYLKDILDIVDRNSDYDICVIDTPPALGALSMNAIAAAKDGVIIPTNMDVMSYRGIQPFIDAVKVIKSQYPGEYAGVIGILMSLYSDRRRVDKSLSEYAIEFFPVEIFNSTIPESSDAKKANLEFKLYSQINKRAKTAYDNLAKEILDIFAKLEKEREQANG